MFNKQSLKDKINRNEIFYPQETSYTTYTLSITPDQNKCYQNIENDKC
jgi:hypothetical protein